MELEMIYFAFFLIFFFLILLMRISLALYRSDFNLNMFCLNVKPNLANKNMSAKLRCRTDVICTLLPKMTRVAASCCHWAVCHKLIISDSEVLVGSSSDFVICGATWGLLLFKSLCATVTLEQSGSYYKPGWAQPSSVAWTRLNRKRPRTGEAQFNSRRQISVGYCDTLCESMVGWVF